MWPFNKKFEEKIEEEIFINPFKVGDKVKINEDVVIGEGYVSKPFIFRPSSNVITIIKKDTQAKVELIDRDYVKVSLDGMPICLMIRYDEISLIS